MQIGAEQRTKGFLPGYAGRPVRHVLANWGYYFLALAVTSYLFANAHRPATPAFAAWCITYFLYLMWLEIRRRRRGFDYDRRRLRNIRIAANVIAVTGLIWIFPGGPGAFWPLYLIPITAALTYANPPKESSPRLDEGAAGSLTRAPRRVARLVERIRSEWPDDPTRASLSVLGLSIAALLIASWFGATRPVSITEILLRVFFLAAFTAAGLFLHAQLETRYKSVAELVQAFPVDAELSALLRAIARAARELLGEVDPSDADRSLRILVFAVDRPDHGEPRCLDCETDGMTRVSDWPQLARDCSVIATGRPHVRSKRVLRADDFYTRHFGIEARSVLAFPLCDATGRCIGVVSATYDAVGHFSRIDVDRFAEFAKLASLAIDGALRSRAARIRSEVSQRLHRSLIGLRTEDDLANFALREVHSLVPSAVHARVIRDGKALLETSFAPRASDVTSWAVRSLQLPMHGSAGLDGSIEVTPGPEPFSMDDRIALEALSDSMADAFSALVLAREGSRSWQKNVADLLHDTVLPEMRGLVSHRLELLADRAPLEVKDALREIEMNVRILQDRVASVIETVATHGVDDTVPFSEAVGRLVVRRSHAFSPERRVVPHISCDREMDPPFPVRHSAMTFIGYAVGNAVQHAMPTAGGGDLHVNVSASLSGSDFHFSVEDDGIGFDPDRVRKGHAAWSLERTLRILENAGHPAQMTVSSRKGHGTVVTLIVRGHSSSRGDA